MALTPVNGDLLAGVASRRTETINPSANALFTGPVPLHAQTLGVAANVVLAALSVVGLNGSGHLVLAVDTTTVAIGVLPYAIDTTGLGAGVGKAEVWRDGTFNPDLLVFGASYSTDALKLAAFNNCPSPTAIYLRRPLPATLT